MTGAGVLEVSSLVFSVSVEGFCSSGAFSICGGFVAIPAGHLGGIYTLSNTGLDLLRLYSSRSSASILLSAPRENELALSTETSNRFATDTDAVAGVWFRLCHS